ncbi:MAG: hypothetical protein E7632_14035, partial [Ruminococcaceae bacterium]|nr:hypothetical protein [Oscillospiraceae bacterium]
MKKLLFLLFAAMLLFGCGAEEAEPMMVDALKIRAWVLEDGLWETGHLEYDPGRFMNGDWVMDDGTVLAGDEVFSLERLEVGVPRVSAPLGHHFNHNLNLWFDFDGFIEVEKAGPEDERLWMGYNLDKPDEPWGGALTKGQKIRMKAPSAVSLVPVGKFSNADSIRTTFTLPNNEYNLIVRAYDYDNTLMITAEIKGNLENLGSSIRICDSTTKNETEAANRVPTSNFMCESG